MLGIKDRISLLIEERYKTIKGFYINEDSEDVYDFTPHPIRYTCLKYFLTTASLPLSSAISMTKTLTGGGIALT